jgi:hypothetical protein
VAATHLEVVGHLRHERQTESVAGQVAGERHRAGTVRDADV